MLGIRQIKSDQAICKFLRDKAAQEEEQPQETPEAAPRRVHARNAVGAAKMRFFGKNNDGQVIWPKSIEKMAKKKLGGIDNQKWGAKILEFDLNGKIFIKWQIFLYVAEKMVLEVLPNGYDQNFNFEFLNKILQRIHLIDRLRY